MATIKVPRTPKSAFDPARRPSALLMKQIEHLEWAVLPASQRKPHQLPKRKVKTEGQAAERIGQLTAMLHAAHAETAGSTALTAAKSAAVTLPPLPPPAKVGSSTATRGIRKRRSANRKTARTRSKTRAAGGRRGQ